MANKIDILIDSTGREYYLYDDLSEKWKDTGHFKKPAPHTMITTSERGRELRTIGVTRQRVAEMRGRIIGVGLDLPENADLETIANLEDRARVLFTAHLGKTFLKSSNLREMPSAYSKLLGLPEPGASPQDPYSEATQAIQATAKLLEFMKEAISTNQTHTIEGKFTTGE